MLSNTLLRITSRRIISTATSQSRRTASSSSSTAFKRATKNETLPIVTAAAIVGGYGIMTLSSQNEEASTAQCLFGKKDTKVREVEDKFATYWPRNIMILFGPPGEYLYVSICVQLFFWNDEYLAKIFNNICNTHHAIYMHILI